MAKTDVSGPFSAILLLVVVCFIVAVLPSVSAFDWNDGLPSYYKLDDNLATTNIIDIINNYNLTLNGGDNTNILSSTGKLNTSLDFNGIDDGLDLTSETWWGVGSNEAYTISFWIYPTENSTPQYIFYGQNINVENTISLNTDNNIIYSRSKRNVPPSSTVSSSPINMNQWYHIVAEYNTTDILLYINGSLIGTVSISGNGTGDYGKTSYFSNHQYTGGDRYFGKIDEVGIWNRSLNLSEISELYNLGDGLTYNDTGDGPTVTLDSPVNDTTISDVGANFTVSGNNLSDVAGEWTNVTYNVWQNSTLVNSTTVDFTDNITFNETLYIDNFGFKDYEWNAEACYTNITGSSCISAIANYTFSVGATVSSSIFNNNTYETSSEIFEIVVELVEGSQLSLARLIYNGTNYTISNISSSNNTYTLTRIIDIPLINSTYQSNSFYWSFIYNGGETQTLGSNSQNVSSIFLSQCNATYTTQSLSFIYFDELNQTLLNAMTYPTSLLLNFKYWLGSGDIKKTYTFQELSSSLNSFQFCISENETFYTDMDLQYYTATDYSERSYYFRNYTLNNVSNDIILYTLLKTEATKFSINIKQGVNVFPDAVVAVWKYFVGLGNYRVVMIGLTDDKGKFSANLDLDQSYNFTINKNNYDYGGFLKQATCLESPCEVEINIGEVALSGFASLEEYFAQNIEITDAGLWNNRTTKMVSIDFVDTTGTASYWRLYVYMNNYNNDTVISICDVKSYASSGNLECNYSDYSGDIVAKLYISRSPEKLVEFINFVNTNAPEIFGTSAILASIIILCVILFSGTVNPVIALVEIPFALVILKFIGFIPFDWSWIAGLTIFILWIAHKVNT